MTMGAVVRRGYANLLDLHRGLDEICHASILVCYCVANDEPQQPQGTQDKPHFRPHEVDLPLRYSDGDPEAEEDVGQYHDGPFRSLSSVSVLAQKPRGERVVQLTYDDRDG